MKIAIVDFGLASHPTYVESITKIYLSAPENAITIFLNERDSEILSFLINDRTKIVTIPKNFTYKLFLSEIANQKNDRIFFISMEVSEKDNYIIAKAFLKTTFGVPVYIVTHNGSRCFQNSFTSNFKRFLATKLTFKNFLFEVKKNFLYGFALARILAYQRKTNGRFVVITEVMKSYVSQYYPEKYVVIVPFSIFEPSDIISNTAPQKKEILRFCIPGYVTEQRRNYLDLLKMLEINTNEEIKDRIVWDFLGGVSNEPGAQLAIEKAKELQLKGYHILFYESVSVPLETFTEHLSSADFILGNLKINNLIGGSYGKTTDSGLPFSMIKKAKPGVINKGYVYPKNLKTSVLEYSDMAELSSLLEELLSNSELVTSMKTEALKNSLEYTPEKIYHQIEAPNL